LDFRVLLLNLGIEEFKVGLPRFDYFESFPCVVIRIERCLHGIIGGLLEITLRSLILIIVVRMIVDSAFLGLVRPFFLLGRECVITYGILLKDEVARAILRLGH